MKLYKDSWHHRLVEYVYGSWYFDCTTSLCKYFWSVVFGLAFIWLIAPLKWLASHWPEINIEVSESTKVIVAKITLLGMGVFGIGSVVYLATIAGVINVLKVLGLVALIIGAIIGVCFAVITLQENIDWSGIRRNKGEKKEKTPNLFWEWLKAKKHKACPILKFE